MRRFLAFICTLAVVSTAAIYSLAQPDKPTDVVVAEAQPKFVVTSEAKNPWTSLTPNTGADQFQFAIVSDRAGGHRAGIFSKAVQQVNLLQPEFVMSVGDLIEGQATVEGNTKEWDEFDGFTKQFQMPFFYCPGNHDAVSKLKLGVYKERYGRPYYHFLYKNCLFVVLNSNDPSEVKGVETYRGSKIGKTQIEWLGGVLKDNADARWTFVFLHHPIWAARDFTESGWLECEKLLAGRKHNVFCGHLHTFRMYPRNGTNYYQLATTGGGSAVRGVEYGEFDQCAWITMKGDQPVISNILLDGILPHDLKPLESTETGRVGIKPGAVAELNGKVTLNGKPATGLQVIFTEIIPNANTDPAKTGSARKAYSGNSRIAADGTYIVYANRSVRGLKPGRYAVTFAAAPSLIVEPNRNAENPVPEKYRGLSTTPFRIEVKAGVRNEFDFDLTGE